MSTFSPELRIELIANGTQAGVWGDTTNRNLGTLIEQAISGYESVTTGAEKYALTTADGASDEARNAILRLNTSTGAAFEVYLPPSSKLYVVTNGSSYDLTLYNSTVLGNTTAAGTGVTIASGATITVYTDGTNVINVGVISFSNNVAGSVVQRDNSGNFSAGAITATTFNGNLVGGVTGNVTGNTSGSAGSLATTDWTVSQVGADLVFKYGGVSKMKLDSSGNIVVIGNVTAYGTI